MMPHGMDAGEWRGVIDAIERLLPYYERVNLATTFGQLPLWRERVAGTAGADEVVLEIGSGPGGFARRLGARRVYCLDPSRSMLRFARMRLTGERYRFLSGLAERIPLRTASVDRVYCAFSFRDFLDKPAAVREIARVLRPGGRLHVLEAARPPPGFRRAFLDSWLSLGTPGLIRMLVPGRVRRTWRENPYVAFLRTYEAFGSPEAYEGLLRCSGFSQAGLEYLSLRSIFHLWGVRARTT